VENEKIKREGGAGKSENKKEIEVEQAKRLSYVQASVTPSDLKLVEQQCQGDAFQCEQVIGKVFKTDIEFPLCIAMSIRCLR